MNFSYSVKGVELYPSILDNTSNNERGNVAAKSYMKR